MPPRPEELFRSAAPYYACYRPGYPPELIAYLARELALDGSQRALDLGCGTGQVAIPLARHLRQVVALDPDQGMLAEGRRIADAQGINNVQWLTGDSYQLDQMAIGPLDLATMGSSFHWMDRPAVLDTLDDLIRVGGAVAVLSNSGTNRVDAPWLEVIEQVRCRWLGPQRRAGSGTYTHPRQRHEEVLAESPFPVLTVESWSQTLTRDVDAIVAAQFSYSYSTPELLGENLPAFADELRAALTVANPTGVFTESVQTELILARRR